MKNNYEKKIKSIFVVLIMALTAFTASMVVMDVTNENTTVQAIEDTCRQFSFATPAANGTYITGAYNITWSNATGLSGGHYWVYIDNVMVKNTTQNWYNWSTFWTRTYTTVGNLTNGSGAGYHNISVKLNASLVNCNPTQIQQSRWVYVNHTPGVDVWEMGNGTIYNGTSEAPGGNWQGRCDVINTSTRLLVNGSNWGGDYNSGLKVTNASRMGIHWESGTTYYLWYPVYNGSSSSDYNLTWKRYGNTLGATIPKITPNPSTGIADLYFGNSGESVVTLDRAGLWCIAPASRTILAGTLSQLNHTASAWFWVNSSRNFTLTFDDREFEYQDPGDLTVTLAGGSDALLAITSNYNGRLVADNDWAGTNKLDSSGSWTAGKINFTYAGNWTAYAYIDEDGSYRTWNGGSYHDYGEGSSWYQRYNDSYGFYKYQSGIPSAAHNYNFSACGPWDPPEKNTSAFYRITVTPGTPVITLTNTTQFWGRYGNLSVNVTDKRGVGIGGATVTIVNSGSPRFPGEYNTTTNSSATSKTQKRLGNTTMQKNWKKGENGTWYVYVRKNVAGDGVVGNRWGKEEWNGSASFTLEGPPGLYIKIIDDGDGDTDMKIETGPPIKTSLPVDIQFQVISKNNSKYGAGGEYSTGFYKYAMKNITISGDACVLNGGAKTLEELNKTANTWVNWTAATGTWTVNLVPSMDSVANGAGQISISAKWIIPNNLGGTASTQTITLGGTSYNGSIVTVSPSAFTLPSDDDNPVSLDVTVTDPQSPDYGYASATVGLYFINDVGKVEGLIEDKLQGTTGGVYTFSVNYTQLTKNQTSSVGAWSTYKTNRYIAAYASIGNSEYGYGSARIKPINDFKITMETEGNSNPSLMAGRLYNRVYFNVTRVNATGGSIGWPKVGSGQDTLQIRIYNSTGDDVTENLTTSTTWALSEFIITSTGTCNITIDNVWIKTPGTYTVYAYNATHSTEGWNATFTVDQVEVTCDKSAFIWGYDKNISATFTFTYNGAPVNGTVVIDNMTYIGSSWNKTWTNTSYTGSADHAKHTATNTSKKDIQVTDGTLTIYNITANNLTEYISGVLKAYSSRDITFWFKSSDGSSEYARCTGAVPVKIPDVAASPKSVPVNKLASLTITVTGRGAPLENVRVNLTVPGLANLAGADTLSDGTALFSFTPTATGNIQIRVENRTSPTKVPVTAWSCYLADIVVNEGESFTATVLNGSATGAALTGVSVTFNGETQTSGYTFTAPTVNANREMTITAEKEGYAQATATVLVVNVPVLSLVLPSKAPSAGATFEVIVADDTGNAIIGATITINDVSFTSGTNGIATITAPSEKGTYDITVSKAGFTSFTAQIEIAGGGIPGFELITLLVAIGVALILLRRRRH